VLAPGVQDVEAHAEEGPTVLREKTLLHGVGADALEGVHARVLRGHAPAEVLHDEVRGQVVEVRLAATGGSRCPYGAVHVEPRPQDGRVADPAGYLPGQP